jgi:hypothetical protein
MPKGKAADSSRVTTEAAEEDRAVAEEVRQTGERARAVNETSREDAETRRYRTEASRGMAEGARTVAEGARASTEARRAGAEEERVTAEAGRSAAEAGRLSAEQLRAAAEDARAAAEEARSGRRKPRGARRRRSVPQPRSNDCCWRKSAERWSWPSGARGIERAVPETKVPPALTLRRRPEPRRQRFHQPPRCSVAHPGDMAVGADQHGRRRGDFAEHRQLPPAGVCRVHVLNAV